MSRPATAQRCSACGGLLTLGRCARCRALWAIDHPRLAKWLVALRVGGPGPWGILRAYRILWCAPQRDVLADWAAFLAAQGANDTD